MNETDIHDDALRWQLRALRQDLPPQRDLWPGIAERIAAVPQQRAQPARRPRWLAPAALAASLLLAVGVVWQGGLLHPAVAPADPLILQQAEALTREYQDALQAMPQARSSSAYAPALRDLDRGAARILIALDHDPNARFLLEQLRRTYARRLSLTQRAALT